MNEFVNQSIHQTILNRLTPSKLTLKVFNPARCRLPLKLPQVIACVCVCVCVCLCVQWAWSGFAQELFFAAVCSRTMTQELRVLQAPAKLI